MNLLSSNERFATGGFEHSFTGRPLSPNPLKMSSVRTFKSVVGASLLENCPMTVVVSTIGKTNTTMKTKDTKSFRSFIGSSPLLRNTALAAGVETNRTHLEHRETRRQSLVAQHSRGQMFQL